MNTPITVEITGTSDRKPNGCTYIEFVGKWSSPSYDMYDDVIKQVKHQISLMDVFDNGKINVALFDHNGATQTIHTTKSGLFVASIGLQTINKSEIDSILKEIESWVKK